MTGKLIKLTYEVELQIGEKLTLPDSLVETLGAGRWLITIQPTTEEKIPVVTRSHEAFLKSYSPEDEGLSDDYQSR
jgi:hypothetical protein